MKISNTLKSAITESLQNKLNVELEDGSIRYVGMQELRAEIKEKQDKLKAAVTNIIITLELGSEKDTVKDLIDAVTFD